MPEDCTQFDTVDVTIDDGLGWITIDREESLNALSLQTVQEIEDAVRALDHDEAVRVIAIRGAGQKAFSAGADLGEFLDRTAREQMVYIERNNSMYNTVDFVDTPIIAGVNGVAFGGGAELLLAADIRVASTHARFSEAEIRVGLVPFTKRLIDIVGLGTATELCLTGREIKAEEGQEIGLFNHVVEPDDLDEKIRTIADEIRQHTERSVSLTKDAILASRDNDLDAAITHNTYNFYKAFDTEEAQERIREFID